MNIMIIKLTLTIALFLSFTVIGYGEEAKANKIELLSKDQFNEILERVLKIHSFGPRIHFSEDLSDKWNTLEPIMIVVSHNVVTVFLDSNLSNPEILEFSRHAGVWSKNNTRWTANYKSSKIKNFTEVFSRTVPVSDEELEIINKYANYKKSLEHTLEEQ